VSQPTELHAFLETIMQINVLRMGGASSGILGSMGADAEVANNLKKSALNLANEYRKLTLDHAEVEKLSNEIRGFLQTLQLMSTLSEKKTDELMRQLELITEDTSV
jgi:hypothetical protein